MMKNTKCKISAGQKVMLAVLAIWAIFLGCDSSDKSASSKEESNESQVQAQHSPRKIEKTSLDDWTMLMYDLKQSGQSPDQSLNPPLELKWKFKTGGQITAGPVVAYDTVYVGSNDGRLYALNAREWGELWNYRAGGEILHSPTVWNKTVYFNATDDKIYAVDAETGELKWEFKTGSWMESPVVVSKGKVYAGVFKQSIYVLDAHTGKRISKKSFKISIGKTLYVCDLGKFRPLNPVVQIEFWQEKTPNSTSLPVFANGIVYIGARDNKLYAFHQETKETIWTYKTNGWIDAAPAISGEMLYVASRDGYVYAFVNARVAEKKKEREIDRQFGIVTHDRAEVYSSPDESTAKLATVNDGVSLPIIDKELNWHKIQLPNGEVGWMSRYDLALFDEYDGIQLNSEIIDGVKDLVLPEGAESPHWSPDEHTIAFLVRTDLKGQYWKATQLWIFEADTKSSKKISDGLFYNPNLSWSLDSKWITFESYYMDSPYIWIIQRNGWKIDHLVMGNAPAFSPKSHQIAFRRWEEKKDLLLRVNIDKSGLRQLAEIPIEGQVRQFNYLNKPVWSPDGKRIALGIDSHHYKQGYARILVADKDGKNFQTIFTHSDYVQKIQWHPDGRKLMYVLFGNHGKEVDKTLDKHIAITDLNYPQTPVATFKHTLPAWLPDGGQIIFVEREDCMGLKWKIWIANPAGGRTILLARTNLNISSIDWLKKGVCIWSTSSYIRAGKYKPAKTIGWLIEINRYNTDY